MTGFDESGWDHMASEWSSSIILLLRESCSAHSMDPPKQTIPDHTSVFEIIIIDLSLGDPIVLSNGGMWEAFSCFLWSVTAFGLVFASRGVWWKSSCMYFDVLLTMHLSIFISVFNQIDAQNLFHNKFYFMPLHVSSTCAHYQEVKIALHSLWYHHTYRRLSRARVESSLNPCMRRPPIGVMIPEAV